MAVERIEEYRQKDGSDILKVYLTPQKICPNGAYFYADVEDIDLVQGYTWYVHLKKYPYIRQTLVLEGMKQFSSFYHDELFIKKTGHSPDGIIDHQNRIYFDNCDVNLFHVDSILNKRNSLSKCYSIDSNNKPYKPYVAWMGKMIHTSPSRYCNEVLACEAIYKLEQDVYKGDGYNFLLDRRDDVDILDQERTGKITSEEATYRHVMRHASKNAWYYYRFNLEDYFKQNNIPVPEFALNDEGRMIDKVTGELLCPLG